MSDSESTMAERLSLLFQIIAMAEQGCVHPCEEEKILVNDPISDALNHVLQYIHQHLKDISSVADVCASQHLSKCTLERLFHRYLHITPSAYITKQKLLLARALLLSEKHREASVSGFVSSADLTTTRILSPNSDGNSASRPINIEKSIHNHSAASASLFMFYDANISIDFFRGMIKSSGILSLLCGLFSQCRLPERRKRKHEKQSETNAYFARCALGLKFLRQR